SWKYSRWRTLPSAQHGCACSDGAVCADSAIERASHNAPTRRKFEMPAHRDASACRTSTAPASSIRRKYHRSYPYSPAAISIPLGARSRINRSPSRSSDDTGSSNHVTSDAANASACASACLRLYAPFASTNNAACDTGPIASRGAHPVDVVTRMRADLHLDARNSGRDPAAELLLQPRDRIRRESPAAIDGHALAHGTEQCD